LVEEFRKLGCDIVGLDQNYSFQFAARGDILKAPLRDPNFDSILYLDVLDHLGYESQKPAIAEQRKTLKDEGVVIFTIQNLAHCYSRLRRLIIGQLIRAAQIEKQLNDRPRKEHVKLLMQDGFYIV